MKNLLIAVLAIVVVGLALYLVLGTDRSDQAQNGITQQEQTQAQANKENCVSDECLNVTDLEYPAGTLPVEVETAIKSAIDDEYKAYSTYDAVIKKLGNVRPFSMIIRAEEQHISSLKAVFDKYGIAIPENPYSGKITSPATLTEACATGSEAEIANAALYQDKLLPAVTSYSDITSVFETLMNASEDKHLPAFNKCM